MNEHEEKERIPARFRDHDPTHKWLYGTLVRVIFPPFAEPYVTVAAERTGALRSRPPKSVEIKVEGPRGGRPWRPIEETTVYDDAYAEAHGLPARRDEEQ